MRSRIVVTLIAALLVVSLVAAVTPAVAAGHGTAAAVECSFPFEETDATGETVTVDDRPERIVVLQPSAAQTVWELNASDRVVGAPDNQYTDYLDGIEDTESVLNADQFSVNQEAVVELDADLVLAPNIVSDDTVDSLREANQTVFKFGFGTSLEFIADKTARTGQLIGSCAEAEATNDQYWEAIETVRNGTEAYDSPRVLHYSGGLDGGAATAGSGTFIDELITTAGGTNVAAENGVEGYGELNDEAIVQWNPDVIMVPDEQGELPETPALESTFAVENDQVIGVNGNYLSQPAPRVVIALRTLAEAFADADIAGQEGETPTTDGTDESADADGTDDTDSEGMTETPEDQSGFGVAVAIVSLVSLLVFARRRQLR
jgi:iron complex transport system substrate-binding protein